MPQLQNTDCICTITDQENTQFMEHTMVGHVVTMEPANNHLLFFSKMHKVKQLINKIVINKFKLMWQLAPTFENISWQSDDPGILV